MTDWLVQNWVGLVALLVSVVLAVIRVVEWWQSRHQVHISCQSMTVGIPVAGSTVNKSYVSIRLSTDRRPVSVVRVGVVTDGKDAGSTESPQIWSIDPPLPGTSPSFPPVGFGEPTNVADGESVVWAVGIGSPPFDFRFGEAKKYRVEIELANGNTYRSKPFWHSQSPIAGWTELDIERAVEQER